MSSLSHVSPNITCKVGDLNRAARLVGGDSRIRDSRIRDSRMSDARMSDARISDSGSVMRDE